MIQIISKGLAKGLSQWDVDRLVQVTGDATHVHFANQGDSKAVIIEIKDGQAKIPEYLLQSGKILYAYAVQDGVTLERFSFPVQKKERPENYVYEDDQRNYIYELISDAENAVADANAAAVNANDAATRASDASTSAVVATGNANEAAASANLAAKSANDAAAKAAHTAKNLMVVGTARGETINLDDAIDQYLVGCRIFGKSTQDGVPTPDAPVEIESVSDFAFSVNTQSVFVPYTLRGIPVSSGGNYIDANGQQWVCDVIDVDKGVHIHRVGKKVFTGAADENWIKYPAENENSHIYYISVSDAAPGLYTSVCSHFTGVRKSWLDDYITTYGVYSDHDTLARKYFRPPNESVVTLTEWNAWLAENPITLVYVLATPIETPLTEEELAAYGSLHTSRGTTTITNDAGAWMEVEYVMDAKKYIDSMITGSMLEATLE